MGSFSPIQIAVVVISIVTLLGVIISLARKSAMLTGYDDYKADILKIASSLKAEIFRDGDDIAISGNYKKFPIQLRFSYSETTPGLNIRMQAPVSFTFSVVPKGARATEGRVLIRTGDEMFDARFAARTDHPTQAKMLVSSKKMRMHMEKLCCSSKTFLTMVTGNIEVSELVIPSPYTARHVLDHLESMAILAAEVESIPGAEKVKIQPYKREQSAPVVKIAIAVGALVAIIAVFADRPDAAASAGNFAPAGPIAEGVLPKDAGAIPKLQGWHAMSEAEFGADFASWIRSSGNAPSGRLELNLDNVMPPDHVYCLTRDADDQKRIVIVQNGANVLDVGMSNVLGVVAIPKSSLESITWKTRPTAPSDGDAFLIVKRGAEDKAAGLIFFRSGGRTISAVPESYEAINLRE